MNLFACYLAISCCNEFSIFFVIIREPGQNVRCHKFGRLCIYVYIQIKKVNITNLSHTVELYIKIILEKKTSETLYLRKY